MSELINVQIGRNSFRWQLLTGVSAVALVTACYAKDAALAEDNVRPSVWIELGGELDRMSRTEESFAPSFVANIPDNFVSPLKVQNPRRYSIDGSGSISFAPHGSDWVFSAAVQYGRTKGEKSHHQQTPNAKVPVARFQPFPSFPSPFNKYIGGYSFYPTNFNFEGATTKRRETHAIVDFAVGKDVGLGLFGTQSSSVVAAGIRFAQFTSQSHSSMGVLPDINYAGLSTPISSWTALRRFKYHNYTQTKHHFYSGVIDAQRSFHGIGPTVSWKGTTPLLGTSEHGQIAFDWGFNGALLFGRQKAKGHHETRVRTDYVSGHFGGAVTQPGIGYSDGNKFGRWPLARYNDTRSSASFDRSHSVVVPNIGGLAGLSFKYTNAKISFGYRADFFFGAIDGGIDTPKSETLGFHGPYAAVSIGLGG